jgi:hypothetical protein
LAVVEQVAFLTSKLGEMVEIVTLSAPVPWPDLGEQRVMVRLETVIKQAVAMLVKVVAQVAVDKQALVVPVVIQVMAVTGGSTSTSPVEPSMDLKPCPQAAQAQVLVLTLVIPYQTVEVVLASMVRPQLLQPQVKEAVAAPPAAISIMEFQQPT